MGRLQALNVKTSPKTGLAASAALIAFSAFASGCDRDAAPLPPPPGTARSEAVKATGNMPTAVATQATAAHAPATPAAPRRLCDGQLAQPGRALPGRSVSHVEAPGAPPLGDVVRAAPGRWTWLNFWAAWCGPCKEEIPRLRAFEAKLAAAGTPISLAFVSIDDDERQLSQFLAAQPPNGLRSSYWLPDGQVRDGFLAGLKLGNSPSLPVQVLVDPQGKARCTIQGAIEDGDYAQIAAVVSSR